MYLIAESFLRIFRCILLSYFVCMFSASFFGKKESVFCCRFSCQMSNFYSFQIKEMNWRVVLIIYEDNDVFLFDESQFTTAVEDLDASMKKTVENKDMKAVIGKQSNLTLRI